MGLKTLPAGLFVATLLAGCAYPPPSAPSIAVMPGKDKSYTAFQQDDYTCRSMAAQSIGYTSTAQTNEAAVGSAVTGTAIGAAAGAAIGAAAGNAGAGAAIGAGTGLLAGSAAGAAGTGYSDMQLQRQYDISYSQCMAAKGNEVPSLPAAGSVAYPPLAPGYYPYFAYPPVYGYYPGYGYLYPSVSIIYGWGWDGWHSRHHR
ncbi:MAG: hypothetical protein B7X08_03210 [Acidocella sp. 20-63-7]|nr:MAG: hypothetical protein B7X08_03210 [Acidocella sp. 20-63-7]